MERDVICLYLIAGVSFAFAFYHCILFFVKRGKTMRTDGTIISIKSTNPTNEKWRNAKLAKFSYLVNGKNVISENRLQVPLSATVGTHITVRCDRKRPEKLYSYSVKRGVASLFVGIGSILIAVFIQMY